MPFIFLALLFIVIAVVLLQEKPQFVLRVRDGKASLEKGTLPARLQQDFNDALRGIYRGKVSGFRSENGKIQLRHEGIDSGTAQRLRNILGIHHL